MVRVINKNYDHSVKEILSEPTRRNPHTKVSSSIHLSPATEGNKTLSTQLYLTRLARQEERKDSKDMQGYLACGFIAFAGSITKCASLSHPILRIKLNAQNSCVPKDQSHTQGDKLQKSIITVYLTSLLLQHQSIIFIVIQRNVIMLSEL